MARFPVRSEMIRYRVNGELIAACLYRPEITSPQGAVIVVDEAGSGDSQIQGVAERYAHVGYPTLLVDLWGGRLMAGEADERWKAANLQAALAWLRRSPFAKVETVGAVGFYEGAHYAMQLAVGENPLQAVVAFYPVLLAGAIATNLRAPVLAFLGGKDQSDERMHRLQSAPTGSTGHELIVYPDISDGFFNERQPAFSFEAAEDAWSRSNKFFYRYLGEPK